MESEYDFTPINRHYSDEEAYALATMELPPMWGAFKSDGIHRVAQKLQAALIERIDVCDKQPEALDYEGRPEPDIA